MIHRILNKIRPSSPTRHTPIPDWEYVLGRSSEEWETVVRAAEGGQKVLLATSNGGWSPGVTMDSALAAALTLRGAEVHVLLCDGALPACQMAQIDRFESEKEFAESGPAKMCEGCFSRGQSGFAPLNLTVHRYTDWVTEDDRQAVSRELARVPACDVASYRWEGIAVGEHALAGALRFLGRGDLEGQPHGEAILRRYLEGALLTARLMRRLLRAHDFDHVCADHGIYVPVGIISEAARQDGRRVSTWGLAYRERTIFFSHDSAYHHTLMNETSAEWEDLPWTPQMEGQVMDYLSSRREGSRDWVTYSRDSVKDLRAIEAELGVDFSRPCVLLLTNLMWDARLFYEDTAFPSMLEWAFQTIRYFATRPDLQLIIRVHPAEVHGGVKSRQLFVEELHNAIPDLPENVFVIPPESEISTYRVAAECNAALIYATKTGLELASFGMPVVVAGEAWIRSKEIGFDANSPEEYRRILDRLPMQERLSEERLERARKYAYHFFFRRMIPLRCIGPTGSRPPVRLSISKLDELRPGRDPGLDLICNGILTGSDFIYPAEQHLTEPELEAV